MMVGSQYYLWTKANWDYTQAYSSIHSRAIQRFTSKRNYDLEKEKTLQKYVEEIEARIKLFENK